MLKKIVILGPESTGKSTLSAQLAAHYKATWVAEYAREYLETNGSTYEYSDLAVIADGQIKQEEIAENNWRNQYVGKEPAPLLFIDTDLHVIKIWSEYVFNKCDNRLLTSLASREYDLYLLCDIDLPWVKDELREYPELSERLKIFHHYKESMLAQHKPWKIINGNYDERLQHAIEAVNELLNARAH
ncbi:MAG: ribosylnicotinamide kinase [Ferruginibacter sp.]|nr:ribosylnicotinamide kinase [Ferruginibacter sp.]